MKRRALQNGGPLLNQLQMFSSFVCQGLRPLPYGAGRLFYCPEDAKIKDGEAGGSRTFQQLKERRHSPNLTIEAQAVTYLTHILHRGRALFGFAEGLAGAGQAAFGSSRWRRADLTLITDPGVARVFQVHERSHIEGPGHERECRLHVEGSDLTYNAYTRWSDTFNAGLAGAITRTELWTVIYEPISECRFLHGNSLLAVSDVAGSENLHPHVANQTELLPYNLEDYPDSFVKRSIEFSDGSKDEHFEAAPSGLRGLSDALRICLGENHIASPPWLPDGYEDEVNYGGIAADKLLEHLLDEGSGAGGFVTIRFAVRPATVDRISRPSFLSRGGHEAADDQASKTLGFCLQRGSAKPAELGPGAMKLSRERAAGRLNKCHHETDHAFERRVLEAAMMDLDSKCDAELTLTRRSYDGEHCIPLDQFRFLVRERGFRDYVLVHYLVSYSPVHFSQAKANFKNFKNFQKPIYECGTLLSPAL